uniref:Acyl-coenzyme A thioesterase 8 n=1 Tax=Strongyloides ratti TaxID=34506 RepID=A0A8L9MXU2_STRRB
MNIYFLSFLTFSSFICSILKMYVLKEKDNLIEHLLLDQLSSNDLTFKTKNIRKNKGRASVYGGQLISNSIFAAQKTVDKDFYCHSSHIYFLNAVNVDGSLIYKVKKIRDSKNFALRKVCCYYGEILISDCNLSFHKTEEPSICHQGVMPDIPKPEDLKEQDFYMEELQKINLKELNSGQILSINIAKNFYHDSFCYRRIYKPMTYFCIERGDGGLQNYYSWIRSFMSDSGIIDYAQKQHIVEGYVPNFSTSLDHSLYFHTSNINMNEWILLEAISPRAEGGRAIIMGKFWSRDGLHLATLIQESLHRTKEAKSKM